MPDEIDLPVTAGMPTHDVPSASGNALPAQGRQAVGSPLTPGQRWQKYQIGDPIDTDTGWCYHAVDTGSLEEREVRVLLFNEQMAMRAQTWRELRSIEMPGLLQGIEAVEEDDYRYEVSPPAPKTSLRAWASCRQASTEDVQVLVQQISDVLITLHDRGVVHLNLSPDTIYILSDEGGLHVTLGGLEHAIVYNQPRLIPVPVDLLYAPPEAAGLSKHSPGASLRAWDWWSLGRIIQELLLGRHVLSLVVNRDLARTSPELRARAEALLLERDPRAPRAGAVELMPPMNQRLTDLMRGLLSSSRGGRWGTEEVLRWLKQLPVKDRYQLGRNEELFAWKDRMFTIEEAAEYFSLEENWADGVTNLFAKDDAMTLVSFVGERPEHKPLRQRIDELHKFLQIPDWQALPQEACRDAIAAAAWLLFGGEDAIFTLHGQRVDATCIKALFARGAVAEGVAMVKALLAKPYIQLIEQAAPDASRLLTSLANTINSEVVSKALVDGWIDLSNPADFARFVLLVLEPERKLMDLRTGLQQRFACSREAPIQHLFTQPRLTHAELVLVASTAAQPERHGYVTHEDWSRERHEALVQRGNRLTTVLFWLRLGQAVRVGCVLFGPWQIVLGIWIAVAGFAGWTVGAPRLPVWLMGTLVGAVALRFVGGKWFNVLIRRQAQGAAPWTFFSRLSRCAQEAGAALGDEKIPLSAAHIGEELSALHAEITSLALKSAGSPLRKSGLVLPAWTVSLAGWAFLVLVLATGYWWRQDKFAPLKLDPKTAAVLAIENAMKAAPADTPLTAEEYFYGDPTNPLERWAVAKPATAPAVPLAKVEAASSDEVAAALIEGQRLLLPYQQNSVDTLIAVPVQGNKGQGLMLYDGRNRRVIERQVILPSELPADKSWFAVGQLKVFYAGAPTASPPPPPEAVHDPQKPFDPKDLPEREIRRGAYQNVPLSAEQKTTNAQPLSEALDNMTP